MVMKTNSAIVNWSYNIVFDSFQTIFFHKTELVRLQNSELCSCIRFRVQSVPRSSN